MRSVEKKSRSRRPSRYPSLLSTRSKSKSKSFVQKRPEKNKTHGITQTFKNIIFIHPPILLLFAEFYKNMMRPSAVASHPAILSDEAFARLKKSMENQVQGSRKSGSLLLLEEGLKMEKWSIPPDDAQFLETRTFQVNEIARIFNIPPHKLAELSRSTFSNIEEQQTEYVVDCLQPWLTNIEQELEYKLFLDGERSKYCIKFAVEGLLRGNSSARADFYSKLFSIGVMTVNEIRNLENLPSIGTSGDENFVPVNLQTIIIYSSLNRRFL